MGKSLLNRFLQHTRLPRGLAGRLVLRGMNCGHARMAEWGLSFVAWGADWRVLDVGCGGGANLRRLLRLCPHGRVWGIDCSEESVAFARRVNHRELERRCFVEQGSAGALPYADAAFDAVTAFETVYFWPDLPQAFAEVKRVLRPGGLFLVCNEASDPSDTRWTSRIEGMRVYGEAEFGRLLSEAGFVRVETHRRGREGLCLLAGKPK